MACLLPWQLEEWGTGSLGREPSQTLFVLQDSSWNRVMSIG